MISSSFTIESSAPIFSFYRKHFGGFTMSRVEIATAPNYDNWNQIHGGMEFSATGWIRTSIDLSGYAGPSVPAAVRGRLRCHVGQLCL